MGCGPSSDPAADEPKVPDVPMRTGPTDNTTIKVITIGNQHVGKTLLIKSFLKKDQHDTGGPSNTSGVDYYPWEIDINGRTQKLGLWDTAGQEQFRAITSSYYRQADGVFLVYDITDRQSWDKLKTTWLTDVEIQNKEAFRVVLANKQDLKGHAIIENGPAEKWCKDHGLAWFGCSALTGESVESSLIYMVTKILEQKRKEKEMKGNSGR